MTNPDLPLVCNVAALVPDIADPSPAVLAEALGRGERAAARVFAAAVAVRELPDGYLVQLRDSPGILALTAEFVELDRRCCAFLRHSIIVDAGGGPIWLELTGGAGAKEIITADLVRLLPERVKPA